MVVAVEVSDGDATDKEVAVFEAASVGVGVGGVKIVADDLAAAFDVVIVAKDVLVFGVVAVGGRPAGGTGDDGLFAGEGVPCGGGLCGGSA